MINVLTIYDNYAYNPAFKTDWGFGCIIDHPRARICYDTGANPEILEANLKTASIPPSSIDTIVISHKHHDHKGGVSWLLQQNPNAKVYIPKTWNNDIESAFPKEATNIFVLENNLLTPEGFHIIVSENLTIRELTLAIPTSQGSLVITGCSHTGIDHIAQKVQETTGSPIQTIFGGFHLLNSSKKNILNTLQKLKHTSLKTIAPCHCTGDSAMQLIKQEFNTHFLNNGAGAKFNFEE